MISRKENRVIYLGQKPIGERCLEMLIEHNPAIRIVAVVSNTDESVWWGSTGAIALAKRLGIPHLDNGQRHEREILKLIASSGANTLISVQHNWIISAPILDAVNGRAFNLHNAKLPEYQGYNACNHAILNGDETYTSTVHWMAPNVDAGDIAYEETFEIVPEETARTLYEKAAEAGEKAFSRLVAALSEGAEIPRSSQKGTGTFYPRDSINALRRIPDPEDMKDVTRRARAFHFPPFEPAFFLHDGRKYHVSPSSESSEDRHDR